MSRFDRTNRTRVTPMGVTVVDNTPDLKLSASDRREIALRMLSGMAELNAVVDFNCIKKVIDKIENDQDLVRIFSSK